jgi:hypothetical protein
LTHLGGEWDSEPDLVVLPFEDDYVGRIVRQYPGYLCGYVGLPVSDIRNGEHYDSDIFTGISVHGGLTYSGFVDPESKRWFLGFDCAHHLDKWWFNSKILDLGNGVYRNIDYVKAEVVSLKEQLCVKNIG